MPSRKRNTEILRALCAQVHPDDGVDPRHVRKHNANRIGVTGRKTRQLCKQVAQALQLAIPNVLSECDAVVTGVEPAPNAGRLRVVVSVSPGSDPQMLADRLKRRSGYLRSEVALAVSRRHVPELAFTIVVSSGEKA